MRNARTTRRVAGVLRVFITDPAAPQYGYGVMCQTGYPSGTVYPILARLEAAGWLVKESEPLDSAEPAPARRIYKLYRFGRAARAVGSRAASNRSICGR
jgi:DNA-binding PadR family transcriptional regulator